MMSTLTLCYYKTRMVHWTAVAKQQKWTVFNSNQYYPCAFLSAVVINIVHFINCIQHFGFEIWCCSCCCSKNNTQQMIIALLPLEKVYTPTLFISYTNSSNMASSKFRRHYLPINCNDTWLIYSVLIMEDTKSAASSEFSSKTESWGNIRRSIEVHKRKWPRNQHYLCGMFWNRVQNYGSNSKNMSINLSYKKNEKHNLNRVTGR
jgi:hypothetical protein